MKFLITLVLISAANNAFAKTPISDARRQPDARRKQNEKIAAASGLINAVELACMPEIISHETRVKPPLAGHLELEYVHGIFLADATRSQVEQLPSSDFEKENPSFDLYGLKKQNCIFETFVKGKSRLELKNLPQRFDGAVTALELQGEAFGRQCTAETLGNPKFKVAAQQALAAQKFGKDPSSYFNALKDLHIPSCLLSFEFIITVDAINKVLEGDPDELATLLPKNIDELKAKVAQTPISAPYVPTSPAAAAF